MINFFFSESVPGLAPQIDCRNTCTQERPLIRPGDIKRPFDIFGKSGWIQNRQSLCFSGPAGKLAEPRRGESLKLTGFVEAKSSQIPDCYIIQGKHRGDSFPLWVAF